MFVCSLIMTLELSDLSENEKFASQCAPQLALSTYLSWVNEWLNYSRNCKNTNRASGTINHPVANGFCRFHDFFLMLFPQQWSIFSDTYVMYFNPTVVYILASALVLGLEWSTGFPWMVLLFVMIPTILLASLNQWDNGRPLILISMVMSIAFLVPFIVKSTVGALAALNLNAFLTVIYLKPGLWTVGVVFLLSTASYFLTDSDYAINYLCMSYSVALLLHDTLLKASMTGRPSKMDVFCLWTKSERTRAQAVDKRVVPFRTSVSPPEATQQILQIFNKNDCRVFKIKRCPSYCRNYFQMVSSVFPSIKHGRRIGFFILGRSKVPKYVLLLSMKRYKNLLMGLGMLI